MTVQDISKVKNKLNCLINVSGKGEVSNNVILYSVNIIRNPGRYIFN